MSHDARTLRVLHVGKFYPPHSGGMETHLHTLCTELHRFANVTVLASSEDRRTRSGFFDGVPVERLGRALTISGTAICFSMARRISDLAADVVHLHLPNPFAVLACMISGIRTPLVVTWHSDVVRQKILSIAFRPFERRFLERCAAIIVTSNKYLESSETLRPHHDKCRVIPFGIWGDRYDQVDAREVERIRHRYGPEIILAVGRLVHYKGFEYLVRAMRKIEATLVIVGDGPLRNSLERKAIAAGVSDRVVFAGAVEDVAPYYQAAELFVLPSVARNEAFGIVQLEAMACAKPVVNTRLATGVPFVSIDGVTGVTVPPADSEALANAINLLLGDNRLRRAYGNAARNRVRQEFSVRRMVDDTLRVYDEVLRRGEVTPKSVEKRTPDGGGFLAKHSAP